METIRYSLDQGIATVTFDEPGSAVNTMKPQWQQDMIALADQLSADAAQLRGVLLTSAKTTFFAGAELKGVLKLTAADAASGFAGIEKMKQAFRRIECMGKPVVSLINGAALGGGWEVALIGHARFCLDNPKIPLGLPEVSLGLLPGATGVTKMTRLLGLMGAQPYLMEGKLLSPQKALELGLVQGLAKDAQALHAMGLAFIEANPQAVQPWDRKDYKMPGGTPGTPKIAQGLSVMPAMMFNKTHGLYPAAQAILECMVEGAQVDYDTATRIESRKLAKLMVGQNAKNMITAFFFNTNAIKAGKSRPAGIAPWKPSKIGVLGAGMMGAGIAYANAMREAWQKFPEDADIGALFARRDCRIGDPAQLEKLLRVVPVPKNAWLLNGSGARRACQPVRAHKAQQGARRVSQKGLCASAQPPQRSAQAAREAARLRCQARAQGQRGGGGVWLPPQGSGSSGGSARGHAHPQRARHVRPRLLAPPGHAAPAGHAHPAILAH
jgi:enoyl-CoA hydratase/carnithine racemase